MALSAAFLSAALVSLEAASEVSLGGTCGSEGAGMRTVAGKGATNFLAFSFFLCLVHQAMKFSLYRVSVSHFDRIAGTTSQHCRYPTDWSVVIRPLWNEREHGFRNTLQEVAKWLSRAYLSIANFSARISGSFCDGIMRSAKMRTTDRSCKDQRLISRFSSTRTAAGTAAKTWNIGSTLLIRGL